MCKGSSFTLEITLYSPIFLIFSLISAKCADTARIFRTFAP
jgi:hypothetical protein